MRSCFAVIIGAVASLAAGCGVHGTWDYRVKGADAFARPPVPLAECSTQVAVASFAEQRGAEDVDRMGVAFVPLVPYASAHLDVAESGARYIAHAGYRAHPTTDLARALAAELRQERELCEVYFSERERDPRADYVVRGVLEEFRYDGKLITYGLSSYGTLLWMLGLPMGVAENTVSIGLQVVHNESGDILFEARSGRHEHRARLGLYYGRNDEFAGFEKAIRSLYAEWSPEIRRAIVEHAQGDGTE